ncbi:hypothetical protein NDU88_003310 [Pleurodeles waltl]|uniref:Uncharacterized protein n=1 Tax=Pleurodeles waltl TaxID=8319 RepID=A0AAV7WSR3_PLEWA|nr:hypothetical protein NDU88_003310 [Pleurodeles waltl]
MPAAPAATAIRAQAPPVAAAAQNPKGREVQTSLCDRGAAESQGAPKGHEGRGPTKPPVGPQAHSRSRHSTLAGSGSGPPRLPAFQITRMGEVAVRPARADPRSSSGHKRAPTAPKASQGLS